MQAANSRNHGLVGPIMLIVIGSIFLVNQFVPALDFGRLWPLIMIAGGLAMLFTRR